MSKSLADLRANPPGAPHERSLKASLAAHLTGEVQALTDELASLTASSGPRRAGQQAPPEAEALRSRIDELLAVMADHEGELRVRAARTDG